MEDGAVCREILRAIGYVPVAPEVRKERRMLCMDQVTACLDRVDGLGDFLELEILVEREEERDAAVGRIEDILGHLGYLLSDTTRTSYLSMLQKKIQWCLMRGMRDEIKEYIDCCKRYRKGKAVLS